MKPTHTGNPFKDERFEEAQLLLGCSRRLKTAILVRDERRWYCFMEAARCLSGAVLDQEYFPDINGICPFIEGAVQNGLWDLAAAEAGLFEEAVEACCIATSLRLSAMSGDGVKLREMTVWQGDAKH